LERSAKMAKIRNFEEIQSWQKARELTNLIYDLTSQNAFSKDFGLRNQIRCAAGSVMHNIAEGFESGTNREFIRFLRMSRRSASEVQSQLCLALDRGYIVEEQRSSAYQLCTEVMKLINGLVKYLQTMPNRID